MNTSTFFPAQWSAEHYLKLLQSDTVNQFTTWFWNTFKIACVTCLVSTFFVLMVAYAMSVMRFKMRKPLMNFAVILNLFPGMLAMIAVYFTLKTFNLTNSHIGLIMVYSASSGLGYLIAKGFFDTISRSIDEAAYIDGATKWDTFTKITIPLSKPIITYTLLTSFMGPWVDYIFAKVIMGNDTKYYTIAIGLWTMLEKEYVDYYYTQFYAGCVLISIPIAIVFLLSQSCYVEGVSGAVKG